MNENIVFKLRIPCLIKSIFWGFWAALFDFIVYRVVSGLEETVLMESIFIFSIAILSNYKFINNIVCFIIPNQNLVAKKYGGINKLREIVAEINNEYVYKDKSIIISKKYISALKNYKNILNLDDVINVYQYILKTNGFITGRDLVIVDKGGKEIHIGYGDNEKDLLKALNVISGIRNDIEIGYIR